MTKLTFAKIIELSNYQVLVVKNYDTDDGSFKLDVTVDHINCRPTVSFAYKTETALDKAFDEFSEERARLIVSEIESTVDNLFE